MKAPYVLALCAAARQSDVNFGVATRSGCQKSSFEVDAGVLIQSLVEYSPAQEAVATQFLENFKKAPRLQHLVELLLSDGADADPQPEHCQQWATNVLTALHGLDRDQLLSELKPVTDFASEYLTHLVVAVRNPGGPRTPQHSLTASESATPSMVESSTPINQLIEEAHVGRNQQALKKLIFRRDGYICALTDLSFREDIEDAVTPRCVHVLPFSLHGKSESLHMIESFTGHGLTAETMRDHINHPNNAFNVEINALDKFYQLRWGIEAIVVDGQTRYFYRKVAPSSSTIRRRDGDEIFFNCGAYGHMLDGPDPQYCNLKLAIVRVFHACGIANIIAKIYDNDDFIAQPTYFGGPVSDHILCDMIHERLAHLV